jgi:CRISPR-associated protein Csb1
MFRKSEKGKILDNAEVRNATGLFGLCPTALVFGIWDSTGPRGGLGAKIQRAIVSEMVGFHAQPGFKTSSRIDPLQIKLGAGPVLDRPDKDDRSPDWIISPEKTTEKVAKKKEWKRPSEINHGNVTPTIPDGGFTISKAVQTTVLSLAAIRRLRFPIPEKEDTDLKARTVLTALGLLGAVLTREEGADLRSRCQLVATQEFLWELLSTPGQAPMKFKLDAATAISIFNQALEKAKTAPALPWEDRILLTPHPDLIELVKRSQELEALSDAKEG